MAGYSGTPLLKKLGIKEGMKVLPLHVPDNYPELLETDISKAIAGEIKDADLVHIFASAAKELEADFNRVIKSGKPGLVIWISWYKKSSGINTDVTEDIIRSIVLPKGWVDTKVCAVSDKWSGLKIVKRKSK